MEIVTGAGSQGGLLCCSTSEAGAGAAVAAVSLDPEDQLVVAAVRPSGGKGVTMGPLRRPAQSWQGQRQQGTDPDSLRVGQSWFGPLKGAQA